MARELDKARKSSPDGDVSSGRALNTLLGSIQKAGELNTGPKVDLDEDTLKQVNLAGSGTAGNAGVLKDVSKLAWPTLFTQPGYDEPRKHLVRNLEYAVRTLKDKDPVPDTALQEINKDYKALDSKLNDAADELSTSEYIEARRFLNQIRDGVRSLRDPNAAKYFTNAWTPKGKTVAELVAQMTREGLSFAPAAPGDQAAYRALYLAMRQFEAGLQTARNK